MDRSVSKQFALGSIFGLMIMVAAMAGLACPFGLQGFVFGIDFVIVLWILASFSGSRSLRPFSNRHLSIAEIATMAAVCLILHGLAMPAVQTGPHRRRATTPVTIPPTSGGTTAAAPTP